ncbi:hypothetical protein C8J56DRAFT_380487 [Mycena floridula]|nr:hypothetical protein C8J56DRAFT_380487 [Mycena floridula]
MTCIEDDREFIRNVRERTLVVIEEDGMCRGGERVGLVWKALRWLPESNLRKRVFIELLQGGDSGEDIWLWNAGDEALILEWDDGCYLVDYPTPWMSAATALERRLTQAPVESPWRKQVQSATLEMRIAMIIWAALTSTAYRKADKERGLRNREEWDMNGLIRTWRASFPEHKVEEWLGRHSIFYDAQAFTNMMDRGGHACHRTRGWVVRAWLFMRSQLLPTQKDHIIYLGCESCSVCLAHKPMSGSESPPSWTPSPALVALRSMWDDDDLHIDGNREFSKWLQFRPIPGFREATQLLSSLPRDTDEDEYLSWVNKYPRDLRHTVTKYSLEEWQAMDDCIMSSGHDGSLNIRSWCVAMFWEMMSDLLSYPTCVKRFTVWCSSVLKWWDFLPPATPVPEFRDLIQDSGHTCWSEEQVQAFSAAMAFLDKDPKVVGIDVQKDSRCRVCHSQWRLRSLGETLPMEQLAFSADLAELLVMMQNECSRRNISWNNVLVSAQDPHVPRPVSNSDHQEQQDPHYTLYYHDEQRYGMSTGHQDAPYHPQPPISQVLHLSESITDISHQDTNILYVQPNSTGSQQDNHSATLMPNLVTNGIQDQDNGAQYPIFHDIQRPSYIHSTRSADVNYNAYGQAWALYDQPMLLQDFEALQTQVPGRRSTPLLISDLMNPSVENDMTSQPRDPAATMTQDDPAVLSARQDTMSEKVDLSKDDMIREINTFFTESFERLGVELHGTNRNKKLPWLQFDDTLEDEGIQMVNWPKDVLTPGKGSNSSKGLAGVPVRDLKKIYKAIHSDTVKLELRHIPGARKSGQAVSQQEFFAQSSASGSRNRPRDAGNADGDIRPKKHLVFKNIRFDGVMEAWKD